MLRLLLLIFLAAYVHGDGEPTSLIFCADNGLYSGLGELSYVVASMKDTQNITISNCVAAISGALNGHNVVAITTGINAVSSALCTQAAMTRYGDTTVRAFFVGTSGWSSALGGPLNPPTSCSNPVINYTNAISVGSVCVTSFSTNFDCDLCTQDDNLPATECARPNCILYNHTDMFGPCSFRSDTTFATDLVQQARATAGMPPMPAPLVSLATEWWQASGVSTVTPGMTTPMLLGPTQCAEVDGNEIWVSAADDYLCREYAAATIGGNATPETVACASAMEATGFMRVLQSNPLWAQIPIAVVRGASNHDHLPLFRLSDGRWMQNVTWNTPDKMDQLTTLGYHYAIATSNVVVLNYFQNLLRKK